MRNYVRVFAVLLIGLWGPGVQAATDFTSFEASIAVNSDASVDLVETITAHFSDDRHGILRTIPFAYETDRGTTVQVPISITSVKRNGQDEPYSTSIQGRNVEVRIGDPDRTITGTHQYTLTYVAEAAVNFFGDHDELYWNVTGDDWEETFEDVRATVAIVGVASADLQTRCVTGPLGATEENCQTSITDGQAVFTAKDELTVVVGWPKGVVTKPANYDQLRTTAGVSRLKQITDNPLVFVGLNIIFPALVIAWLIRRWLTHGRDPKRRGTIMAQYEPPPGLTPGEMGTLFDERANRRDVVATIIDLAVRGYLTITEIKREKFLGIGKRTDYQLDRQTKGDSSKLKSHEQKLMSGLFADGDSVKLSELKGTFHDEVRSIQWDLYTQLSDQGYFVSNPNSVRVGYAGAGIALAVVSFFGFDFGIVGTFIAGAAIAIAAPFMPKRTTKGVEAFWHAQGFKLFLAKAEKYRLQWQEKEHIFEELLPFAMAFGVAEKWSKAFEGIQKTPPGWYHGSQGTVFNSFVLWSALNDFSTTTTRTFAPAASGSSGFGGGGFSGGGFGGGGGGSW